jgi:glycosyltransferase involved in cell wall biosynthesis
VTSARITVFRSSLPRPPAAPDEFVVSDDEVRAWVLDGRIVRHALRYRSGRFLTERLATTGRPGLAWALWLMARGRACIEDLSGCRRNVTTGLLLRWSWHLAGEALRKGRLRRKVEREVSAIASAERTPSGLTLERSASPLYLRTDLSFGVRAGGSVGHIAGVVNELGFVLGPPIVLTAAAVPTLRTDIEVHHVDAPEAFWNFRELPTFVLNDVLYAEALSVIQGRRASLVYQRYSVNAYAGLRIARRLGVPFVLEYNGSEIWKRRHWHRPLKYEALASRIELLNINAADLVVVVSRALRDELVSRGASSNRILVNPNAADPDRYSPTIDGAAVTARYRLEGKTVIGFIATFQPWHGAEVLAEAFVHLLRERPAYRDSVRLLMMGTGPRLTPAKEIVSRAGLSDCVVFTDLISQEDGPQHLAACDILTSPHVPNPDGSPFFGSPTKLFEYMAMGKGIVASNLDQIGDVLRHGETAWLVPPADPHALAAGLARLVEDTVLQRALGEAARRDLLAHHTWRSHVRRTIDALEARLCARVA